MDKSVKRKQYFIHPSSQLKYIEMTVLPALILSIFCTFFVVRSGEIFLKKEKAQLSVELSYLNDTIARLSQEKYPAETITKVEVLKKRLSILQQNLEIEYFNTVKQWANTKIMLLFCLAVGLFFVGFMALLFSHRIAGPIMRLKKLMEMIAEGQDVPAVKFRNYDEFKELAVAFEKLRKSLKAKGVLK
jgi:nitrogen fixation/metabolism regulation signal transduction histidine kinase